MEILLAYCGLSCNKCPVHLATMETDRALQEKMKESIVEECSKIYGLNLLASEINDCDGCRANTGRLFKGCLDCEIRRCARTKSLESCAFCNDYACDKLLKHFEIDSEARLRLEKMRLSKSTQVEKFSEGPKNI